MSKNEVDYSDVFKELRKVRGRLEKESVAAINEATEYAARYLVAKTPYSKGKKYKTNAKYEGTKHRQYDKYHAKHHVVTQAPTKKDLTAQVGFDDDVAWRMHFIEFGTIKQKPQHFVQKTVEEIQETLQKIIEKRLRRVIK